MKQTCNKSLQILVWKSSSNTRLSCFIKELETLEKNKNLEASPLGFHNLLVFGIHNETLKTRVRTIT